MKRMFLSVIVIAFLIMACDATSIVPQEPLPTVAVLPQPSLTPYPTQPVPTRYPTQVPPVPMVGCAILLVIRTLIAAQLSTCRRSLSLMAQWLCLQVSETTMI
jgi:hypothetical protein